MKQVKTADDITLSRLNLLESPFSPQSSEKKDKTAVKNVRNMSSSDVEIVRRDHMAYKHRDVKALRLTRRNRSVSLDRYLFLKTKQLAKGLNIFLHNAEKSEKMNTWDQNRLNRCRSLPKITKDNICDSNEYCVTNEMVPLEKNARHEKIEGNEERISNGEGKNVDPNQPTETNSVTSENSPSNDSLDRSNGFHTSMNQTTVNGGTTAVHKVGHAVSLDTHLMIENGQLIMPNCNNDEFSCASHLANKEDAFIQGRHCSCPSLHCADHFSEAITTCLDLGRTERSVIPEAEDDNSLETAHAPDLPCNHDTHHHKPSGHVHAHSQSEALEKIFQKPKW
ncbi:hypothetical protein OS493_023851 [Desmophyllum pertusum]|uniref:Uncharacterized protein n=1 Tax=Desmophyllum pertusum TaxID=174260 RepID=A0A9W9YM46_9CNID|nr:hypothetical protein OS493_023851 [Desmophyllum pertusum]